MTPFMTRLTCFIYGHVPDWPTERPGHYLKMSIYGSPNIYEYAPCRRCGALIGRILKKPWRSVAGNLNRVELIEDVDSGVVEK